MGKGVGVAFVSKKTVEWNTVKYIIVIFNYMNNMQKKNMHIVYDHSL